MLYPLTINDFDAVYNLLKDSFPPEERRSLENQKQLLSRPYYQLYTFKTADFQGLSSFVAVWNFDEILYVEHFAVHPALRGGGLGTKLLDELKVKFQKPICLEVEPPDTPIAQRRIAFYERNGFFLNPYPYTQPSLGEGRPAIPLLIMTHPAPIDEDTFIRTRDLLYRHVFML